MEDDFEGEPAMSHLHIPDGVIAPAWLICGFIAMTALLILAVMRAGQEEAGSRISRLGILSAFMLLAMNIPLGFLPVHLNFTVLAAFFLGPWLGVIAVFVVNVILALVGHGGLTVLGLNTLVLSSEALLGYYLFAVLRQRARLALAAAAATVLALTVSLTLMIGIVGLTQTDPLLLLHEHHGKEEGQIATTIPATIEEEVQNPGGGGIPCYYETAAF
jgi:cobalt/nickel transport system permease protein